MNYELAEKLLRAGFPMKRWGEIRVKHTEEGMESDSQYGFPTLSELIAACGEEFFALKVYFSPETEWVAMPRESGKTLQSQHYGKTPEEAVANLYLALHSKS